MELQIIFTVMIRVWKITPKTAICGRNVNRLLLLNSLWGKQSWWIMFIYSETVRCLLKDWRNHAYKGGEFIKILPQKMMYHQLFGIRTSSVEMSFTLPWYYSQSLMNVSHKLNAVYVTTVKLSFRITNCNWN